MPSASADGSVEQSTFFDTFLDGRGRRHRIGCQPPLPFASSRAKACFGWYAPTLPPPGRVTYPLVPAAIYVVRHCSAGLDVT
jgi:hypothetical protein